ncbi:MAG: GtrA family protein [Acidobacteria bacterium]|nr:GtrA family protein [Acidobacteriota bacterium]
MTRGAGVRWLKFNFVGGLGVLVQLGMLVLLKSGFGLHYLAATALAVEAAVLHNFLWHQSWTWSDRPRGSSPAAMLARLVRFHAANGAVSIVSNLILMKLFVGALGLPYFAANLVAIALTSIANFLLADRAVFSAAWIETP